MIKGITKEDIHEDDVPDYDENNDTFKMLQCIAVVNNKGEFDYALPGEL